MTAHPAGAQVASACAAHCFDGLDAFGDGNGIATQGARANISDYNPNVPTGPGQGTGAWVGPENVYTGAINQIGWARGSFDQNVVSYFYEWTGVPGAGQPNQLLPPVALFAVPASELTSANNFGTSITHLYSVFEDLYGEWFFQIDGHNYFTVSAVTLPSDDVSPRLSGLLF